MERSMLWRNGIPSSISTQSSQGPTREYEEYNSSQDVHDHIEGHQEYEEGMDLNRGGLMSIEEEDPARKQAIFEEKLTEMAAHGYTNEELDAVRQVWSEYASQFTLGMPIGSGMDVPPLIIELKEGALPKHAKRAKYNEAAKAFLHEQTRKLVESGMWYLNPRARCSSRALVQAKPHGGSRLCVDLRRLNSMTVPMSWVPLDFDSIGIRLSGSRVFITLDASSGYFQLPVHEQSQELFSVSTHEGIYTSARTFTRIRERIDALAIHNENRLSGTSGVRNQYG